MKIWHRANLRPELESLIRAHDVPIRLIYSTVEPGRLTHLLVDLDESNPVWPRLEPMVREAETFVWTEFSVQEALAAEWSVVRAAHSVGSSAGGDPWSADYFEGRCRTCGVGWRQKAPLVIDKEPRIGRHSFASFWGGFELFCTPEVLDVFAANGIEGYDSWPLLLPKTKGALSCLRQLIVETTAGSALEEELAETQRFRKERCPTCGNVWHTFYVRGMMPLRRSALHEGVDFQLTHEWFGSGRAARREILVSNRVARLAMEHKWKGLYLAPVQLV